VQTVIIAFGHKSGHGKDEAVKAIIEARGKQYGVRRYAFADALKRECCGNEFEMCLKYGIAYDPNAPSDDPLCNSRHGKQRALLQFWGGYRRQNSPAKAYWINLLEQRL
jgi:hypothetical protein